MNVNATTTSEGGLAGRTGLIGLLAVQIIVGYVWLMSGLVKVLRGGFPSGLAAELEEKSEELDGWYKSFLDGTVIPNAEFFGVLIILGELAVGVVLMVAAVLWIARWDRLSGASKQALLWGTAAAAFVAILLNLNFHLANGSAHPWLIPEEGFDEGVDLDSMMPLIEAVLMFASARAALALRRQPVPASE